MSNDLQVFYKINITVTLPLSSMSLPRAAIVSTSSETSTSSVIMPTKMQFSFVPNSRPEERGVDRRRDIYFLKNK